MEDETMNGMQFENAEELQEQLAQIQLENELLKEQAEQEREARLQAEKKKGLALKAAKVQPHFSEEELIEKATQRLAEKFDLSSLTEERITKKVQENLSSILDSKPELKDVANTKAITEYVKATGKTVEEALDTLYGNMTKQRDVIDSDTTRNNKGANTSPEDELADAIKQATGY